MSTPCVACESNTTSLINFHQIELSRCSVAKDARSRNVLWFWPLEPRGMAPATYISLPVLCSVASIAFQISWRFVAKSSGPFSGLVLPALCISQGSMMPLLEPQRWHLQYVLSGVSARYKRHHSAQGNQGRQDKGEESSKTGDQWMK